MDFHVYIVRCSDGSYYTGHTEDLDARIAAHNSGELGGYTSKRRPVQLVFSEDFFSRDQAFQAERQIKGWRRAKKEALIRGDWDGLVELSKAYGSTRKPSARPARPSTGSEPALSRAKG